MSDADLKLRVSSQNLLVKRNQKSIPSFILIIMRTWTRSMNTRSSTRGGVIGRLADSFITFAENPIS